MLPRSVSEAQPSAAPATPTVAEVTNALGTTAEPQQSNQAARRG